MRMTRNDMIRYLRLQNLRRICGMVFVVSTLTLFGPVWAQDSLETLPNFEEKDPPRAKETPEESLDALKPFDPDAGEAGVLNKGGDLQDHIDPDALDDELKRLLQNLPEPDENLKALDELPVEKKEAGKASAIKDAAPDYSKLSKKAEQSARLEALFERLGRETDAGLAELIAEEIWAIWLDSGSASVDLLIRRGTAAQKRRNFKLARHMYDHATAIMPDYAEGWSRSARLAIEEEDLGRALTEVTETLIREPRHFYALWTLGNLLERLGQAEAALEAYVEANKLYPELKAVKDRVEFMRGSVEGNVL